LGDPFPAQREPIRRKGCGENVNISKTPALRAGCPDLVSDEFQQSGNSVTELFLEPSRVFNEISTTSLKIHSVLMPRAASDLPCSG
jgi:hypothetical protein